MWLTVGQPHLWQLPLLLIVHAKSAAPSYVKGSVHYSWQTMWHLELQTVLWWATVRAWVTYSYSFICLSWSFKLTPSFLCLSAFILAISRSFFSFSKSFIWCWANNTFYSALLFAAYKSEKASVCTNLNPSSVLKNDSNDSAALSNCYNNDLSSDAFQTALEFFNDILFCALST